MHLRVSTVRRRGNVYRYAQLVQSVRDDRGKSTTRVVKHLGKLPESIIAAMRVALQAAGDGDGLVLQSRVAELLGGSTLANLRYLDLAVLIDQWRRWGLGGILDELAGPAEARLSFSDGVITVTSAKGKPMTSFRGSIVRKEQVWARRRRHDGFVLLLGHPELQHTGVELVDSYRGKDVVEKGFQSIKSVAELRPIYHYRDPKVQAHVTLCMLALVVMRSLEQRFREAGAPMTAPACIEALAPVHLNLRAPTYGEAVYDITRLNAAQRTILDVLGAGSLSNDKDLRPQLTPRTLTD